MNWYLTWGKRGLDLLLALPLAVFSLPIAATTWLLIRFKLGKPVLFRQNRPGLNGELFEMVKFRSMTDGRDRFGNLLPDEERLTKFGMFLRSSSLDEIPELWNVIKGDMSIVGPRPLLASYLPKYTPEQARRHECRPGVTGLAQIRGRNNTDWEERLALDVDYVQSISLRRDLAIMARTLRVVASRSGVYNQELKAFTGEDGSTNAVH